MKYQVYSKTVLAGFIFTLITGLSVASAANKVVVIPLGSDQATTVTTGYLSIPASALLPKDDGVSYSTNGGYMGTASSSKTVFYAPVFLPHKSAIKSVTLEALDNSGGEFGGYIEFALVKFRTAVPSVISTLSSGGPGEAVEGTVQLSETVSDSVDNSTYSYGLDVGIHNGAGGPWSVLYYNFIIEYEK